MKKQDEDKYTVIEVKNKDGSVDSFIVHDDGTREFVDHDDLVEDTETNNA
jgi:hypothetical protein